MSEAHDSIIQQLHGRRAGERGYVRVRCPFCLNRVGKEDKGGGALSVSVETGWYHCFRCKKAGRVDEEELSTLAFKERFRTTEATPQEPPREFMLLSEEPARSAQLTRPARQYLIKRKIGPALWEEASIGVCLEGRYGERVVVPVFTPEGAWHGFVARTYLKHERGCDCWNCQKKYLNSAGMSAGTFFYNHNALELATERPLLIVEGVFDALAYWPHAMASLGHVGHEQKAALLDSKRPICFVPDGDDWESGMWNAMALRYEGVDAGFVRLPPRTDPDEVDKDWLIQEAARSITAPINT